MCDLCISASERHDGGHNPIMFRIYLRLCELWANETQKERRLLLLSHITRMSNLYW
jgi:hypothetical protein